MKRIEYKIRDVNLEWLETILEDHQATKTFEGELFTTYFDKSGEEFVKSGQRLSVRHKGSHATITFRDKYSKLASGDVQEYTLEADDAEAATNLLLAVGFKKFKTFKNYRYDYKVDCKIDCITISFDKYLDDLEFIPEFMTIEGDSEEKIMKWVEKFGYLKSDCEAISVVDLIKDYRSKK
jgi:adenylate cyclase class IV